MSGCSGRAAQTDHLRSSACAAQHGGEEERIHRFKDLEKVTDKAWKRVSNKAWKHWRVFGEDWVEGGKSPKGRAVNQSF